MVGESEVCQMKLFKINQVFVYDHFEGSAFQHVLIAAKQNKAVLVYIYSFVDIFVVELLIIVIQIGILHNNF